MAHVNYSPVYYREDKARGIFDRKKLRKHVYSCESNLDVRD